MTWPRPKIVLEYMPQLVNLGAPYLSILVLLALLDGLPFLMVLELSRCMQLFLTAPSRTQ